MSIPRYTGFFSKLLARGTLGDVVVSEKSIDTLNGPCAPDLRRVFVRARRRFGSIQVWDITPFDVVVYMNRDTRRHEVADVFDEPNKIAVSVVGVVIERPRAAGSRRVAARGSASVIRRGCYLRITVPGAYGGVGADLFTSGGRARGDLSMEARPRDSKTKGNACRLGPRPC
jgi:hypothetical protein